MSTPPAREQGRLIYVIAGEPSGDLLGGRLMSALRQKGGADIRFAGVGGTDMTAAGLTSLFPMHELSLMGLAEVVPHIPKLLRRIRETVADVRRLRPAAVITIDSPGFTFRVAQRLKGAGIPLIHYVAPTVWAWKPGRARKVAQFLDHMLALLPFEPPFFEREGLPCTFVGHPVIEGGAGRGSGQAFRDRMGLEADTPLVCVLPGSRAGEVDRLLPIFAETVAILARDRPGLRVVVPTVAAMAGHVREAASRWAAPVEVLDQAAEKYDAFAAANVALAASGTVALELAMAETPAVIAYRFNPVTAWFARRMIRVRFANLVNILLDREAVPEFLQERCRADLLAAALGHLLDDGDARRTQVAAASDAMGLLGKGGPSPSARAADVVLEIIGNKV